MMRLVGGFENIENKDVHKEKGEWRERGERRERGEGERRERGGREEREGRAGRAGREGRKEERSYSTYGGAVVVVEVAEHQLIVH